MKFCSECGQAVVRKKPEGDTHLRYVCTSCETIHYQNPNIVTGCIPEWQGRILLCRRAIEPRHGLWTLPAGFMENNETTAQAAIRETMEEARARVDITDLYTMFNLPHVNQVYIIFRAQLNGPDYGPGEESLEVKLFELDKLPWDEMAFAVIRETLKLYCQDASNGKFALYTGDIVVNPENRQDYQALNICQFGI